MKVIIKLATRAFSGHLLRFQYSISFILYFEILIEKFCQFFCICLEYSQIWQLLLRRLF